jgi:hypothetical protein
MPTDKEIDLLIKAIADVRRFFDRSGRVNKTDLHRRYNYCAKESDSADRYLARDGFDGFDKLLSEAQERGRIDAGVFGITDDV